MLFCCCCCHCNLQAFIWYSLKMKGTVFVVKLESGDIQDTLEALKVAFYIPTITIETVSCLFFPQTWQLLCFLKMADRPQSQAPTTRLQLARLSLCFSLVCLQESPRMKLMANCKPYTKQTFSDTGRSATKHTRCFGRMLSGIQIS